MAGASNGERNGNGTIPPEGYTEMPVFVPDDHEHPGTGAGDGASGEGYSSAVAECSPVDETERTPMACDLSLARLKGWVKAAWAVLQPALKEFVAVQGLALVLTAVSCGLLVGPVGAGTLRFARRRMNGEQAELSELFSAFEKDRFVPTFLAGVGYLAALVLVVACDAGIAAVVDAVPGLGWLLTLAVHVGAMMVAAGLGGAWCFILAQIDERKESIQGAWDVLARSFRSDWVGFGGLFVAIGMWFVAGGLAFGLGILVGGPLGFLVATHAFREVFARGARA